MILRDLKQVSIEIILLNEEFLFDMLPKLYQGNENLLAKTEYSKYFSKDFKENVNYFKMLEENIIYKANLSDKTLRSDVRQYLDFYQRITYQLRIMPVKVLMLDYYLENRIQLFFLKILFCDFLLKNFRLSLKGV